MAETSHSTDVNNDSPIYVIRLRGHLGARWATWFEGMEITLEPKGETLLTGPIVDQAALHGLLAKLRDLGIPLISVTRQEPEANTTESI